MQYELHITHTAKSYSPKDSYKIFDEETIPFSSIIKLSDYLRQYKHCKRENMYRDRPDGTAEHIGFIYGFRASDGSEKWLQRDWVSIYKVARTPVPGKVQK